MVLGLATTANAHMSRVFASCVEGRGLLVAELLEFESAEENTVVVHDNGVQLIKPSFGAEYRNKWTDLDGTLAHRFVVTVAAWDDPDRTKGWSFHKEVEVPRCAPVAHPATSVSHSASATASSRRPALSSPVPEPSTSSAAGAGAVVVARRRRPSHR